jgi:hypothetical protein
MRNRKYKILLIVAVIFIALYTALFFAPVRNRVNNLYNTIYVRVTTIVRRWKFSHLKDEAPGVGPGNNPISVKDPDHFTFAVLGDTQNFELPDSSGGFVKAVGQIEKMKPDFVMTVGDLVDSCGSPADCASYKAWKNIAKPILPITYEVVGNHDRIVSNGNEAEKTAADKEWQNYFNLPTNGPAGFEKFTYSFNIGNSHFVILDSEKPKEHVIGQDQLDWLEKDLSANTKDNTFIFYHEPAFPMSYKIGQSLDYHQKERDAFWSIIDKYNVTAVFNGHEHIYSRQQIDQDEFPAEKNGIYQFIIGNTDAYEKQDVSINSKVDYYHKGHDFCLVDVNGKQITVKLLSVDGNLVDSFTFSK